MVIDIVDATIKHIFAALSDLEYNDYAYVRKMQDFLKWLQEYNHDMKEAPLTDDLHIIVHDAIGALPYNEWQAALNLLIEFAESEIDLNG